MLPGEGACESRPLGDAALAELDGATGDACTDGTKPKSGNMSRDGLAVTLPGVEASMRRNVRGGVGAGEAAVVIAASGFALSSCGVAEFRLANSRLLITTVRASESTLPFEIAVDDPSAESAGNILLEPSGEMLAAHDANGRLGDG